MKVAVDYTNIPTAIFSTPEAGTVGLSEEAALARLEPIDYFHQKGVAAGYDYMEKEDKMANRKFIGLARSFLKQFPDNWKEAIDWWFESDNAWCDYHPSNFFSVNTYLKFKNRAKTAPRIIKL
jgi:hypothetical protein